jgi:hypothetical protein
VTKYTTFFLYFFIIYCTVSAAEFNEGNIRLILDEKRGTFSLYYVTRTSTPQSHAFLRDNNSRNTFIAVMLNDRVYRPDKLASFKSRLGGTPANPALIFESATFRITQEFSFIRTVSSLLTNGITMTIKLENTDSQPVEAGLKILLDTGKEGKQTFSTNDHSIAAETVFDKSSTDRWWISNDTELGIMGNIAGSVRPDLIHISSLSKLSGTPWKAPFNPKKPVTPAAIAYYFDPVSLLPGESVVFSIILATTDERGFATPAFFQENTARIDARLVDRLIARLDHYINTEEPVSDDELTAIAVVLNRLKARYTIP